VSDGERRRKVVSRKQQLVEKEGWWWCEKGKRLEKGKKNQDFLGYSTVRLVLCSAHYVQYRAVQGL